MRAVMGLDPEMLNGVAADVRCVTAGEESVLTSEDH
jgi:hypothetical protein